MSSFPDRFPHLHPGESVDNRRLTEIFRCSPQGGLRRSLQTNSLVLIWDTTQSIYLNRWREGIIHYAGIGLVGDQELHRGPNRALSELPVNEVSAFLFARYERGTYTYIGEIEPAGPPIPEHQRDRTGRLRKVWVFPLRLKGGKTPPPIPEWVWDGKRKMQERAAARLPIEKVIRKAREVDRKPGMHTMSVQVYDRDPFVSEYVRRRANGRCELCGKKAPFRDHKGAPYLEMHHVTPLSGGGEDTTGNTVALCPNCHRKMHVLNLPIDAAALRAAGEKNPVIE